MLIVVELVNIDCHTIDAVITNLYYYVDTSYAIIIIKNISINNLTRLKSTLGIRNDSGLRYIQCCLPRRRPLTQRRR